MVFVCQGQNDAIKQQANKSLSSAIQASHGFIFTRDWLWTTSSNYFAMKITDKLFSVINIYEQNVLD